MSDELSAIAEVQAPEAKGKKGKKGKKTFAEEIEQSTVTVNKSLPIPTIKKDVAQHQPYFQVAARAICTCGEVMARPREIPNSDWTCMRILTGNKPTKECQVVKSHMIRVDLPPPFTERSDDDEGAE